MKATKMTKFEKLKLSNIFKYCFCEKEKVKIIKLGNDDYKNIGRKFSKEDIEKYLDPYGFLNDVKDEIKHIEENETNTNNIKEVSNNLNTINDKNNEKSISSTKKISKEYGMKPKGPEPTRYGDWERNGKCVDF